MRFLYSTVLATSLALGAGAAHAQLHTNSNTADPLTGLPVDQWTYLMTHAVNGAAVVGKPEVFMVNPTGESLTVNCGKWVLVGGKPYIEGNPTVLPPWSVTVVGTQGFDGYCKDGVNALSSSGLAYHGALVSPDGTFSNATFIVLSK